MRSQSFTIGDTYSFSPTTLNAFHATVHRMRNNRGPSPKFITGKDLGVNMFIETPNNMALSVSNSFSVGCGTCAPGFFNITTYSLADDVDLIRGRHQIAFGVNILRSQDNLDSGFNQNGVFTFNGQSTNDPMLDFQLGIMSTWDQSRAQLSWYRKTNIGLYVQDTFRVNSRLSINAGLRWEPDIPPVDTRPVGSLFDQAAFNAGQHSKVFVNGPAGDVLLRRSRRSQGIHQQPAEELFTAPRTWCGIRTAMAATRFAWGAILCMIRPRCTTASA